MRVLINRRRENKGPYDLTYRVTVPNSLGIITRCFSGHFPLSPVQDAMNQSYKITGDSLTITGNLEVLMTISVKDIYPLSMGYSRYEGKPSQCHHIWIDGQPYTMVDITYP